MGRKRGVTKKERISPIPKKKMPKSDDDATTSRSVKDNVTGQEQEILEEPQPVPIRINPLLIDTILEKVFKFVVGSTITGDDGEQMFEPRVYKDVKATRLVCRLWRERVTQVFRKTRPSTRFGAYHKFRYQRAASPDIELDKFIEVMNKSPLNPVQRYVLLGTVFAPVNRRLIGDFLETCALDANEICIRIYDLEDMYFTRKSTANVKMDKLETLIIYFNELRFYHKQNGSVLDNIFGLVEFFLKAASNLKSFTLWLDADSDGKLGSRMIEICKQIPKTVTTLRLSKNICGSSHLNILAEKKLNLEQLAIKLDKNCKAEAVREYFGPQSETLKTLAIGGGLSLNSSSFPTMHEVRHLEFVFEEEGIAPSCLPDLFPKLEVIDARDLESEDDCTVLFSSAKRSLTVEKLFLPYDMPAVPFVRKAAGCYPNLRHLYISRNEECSEVLKEVYNHFPNIEELHVTFSIDSHFEYRESNLVALLSGIRQVDRRRFLRKGNFQNVKMATIQRQPSLLTLTKLKKLTLEDVANYGALFTDFEAYFTFSQMESLEELLIDGFQATPKCKEILNAKLKAFNSKWNQNVTFVLESDSSSDESGSQE